MPVFAEIVLNPSTMVAWLVVGLIASWLAGKVMEVSTFGLIGDLIICSIGAMVGGIMLGLFVTGAPTFLGSILAAFIGAGILMVAARAIAPSRSV